MSEQISKHGYDKNRPNGAKRGEDYVTPFAKQPCQDGVCANPDNSAERIQYQVGYVAAPHGQNVLDGLKRKACRKYRQSPLYERPLRHEPGQVYYTTL
jgi:hypothetical protein